MEQGINVAKPEATPAATPKINITTINDMRKAMLLTQGQMAILAGVSRVTYHNWLNGKRIADTNASKLRKLMRRLSEVVNTFDWPTREVAQASAGKRFEMLLEMLNKLDETAATQ